MYEKGNVSIREEKKIPRMFHSRSHFGWLILNNTQILYRIQCTSCTGIHVQVPPDILGDILGQKNATYQRWSP